MNADEKEIHDAAMILLTMKAEHIAPKTEKQVATITESVLAIWKQWAPELDMWKQLMQKAKNSLDKMFYMSMYSRTAYLYNGEVAKAINPNTKIETPHASI